VPRPDCAIYRGKPLPREAFWRTAQQAAACLVTPTIRATGERLASGNPTAVPALSITAKVGSIDLGTYREDFGFRGIASLFPA
jgi:hypothetical protein